MRNGSVCLLHTLVLLLGVMTTTQAQEGAVVKSICPVSCEECTASACDDDPDGFLAGITATQQWEVSCAVLVAHPDIGCNNAFHVPAPVDVARSGPQWQGCTFQFGEHDQTTNIVRYDLICGSVSSVCPCIDGICSRCPGMNPMNPDASVSAGASLRGGTFTGLSGLSGDYGPGKGGALGINVGNVIVANTDFIENTADCSGGAVCIGQCNYFDSFTVQPSARFEFSEFRSNVAVGNWDSSSGCGGGAVSIESNAAGTFQTVVFRSNIAKQGGNGGAIHIALPVDGDPYWGAQAGSGLIAESCIFDQNVAGGDGMIAEGSHIYALAPAPFKVYSSTFEPFEPGPMGSVSINTVAGCEQYPCNIGQQCSYINYSLLCEPCPGATVSVDGLRCAPCDIGFGPNTEKTACQPCGANEYGIGVCQACLPPYVVTGDKTSCVAPFKCDPGSSCLDSNCNEQNDCEACAAGRASLGILPCVLCDEQGKVAAEDGSVCEGCSPGTQPKADRSACEPCTASTYSTFGIECLDCAAPSAVNSGKTSCTPPYQCTAGSSCPDGVDCNSLDDCAACGTGMTSLGIEACVLCDDLGKVANADQTGCEQCTAGRQPNTARSACVECIGNTFAQFGIQCDACRAGRVVDATHTGCDDINEIGAGVSDMAIVLEILGSSNVLPEVSLQLAVEAAALVAGSDAQNELFTRLTAEMAVALDIDASEIDITFEPPTGAGRRLQTTPMAFVVSVRSADASATLTELATQLNDPGSALMNSPTAGAIDGTTLSVTFACQAGFHKPNGAADCLPCSGTSIPNPTDNTQCIECPYRMSPDPATQKTSCVCAVGFYDSSHSTIKCYAEGQRFDEALPPAVDACTPCGGMECIECGQLTPSGALLTTTVKAGYGVSTTALGQGVDFMNLAGQRAIFPCPGGTCTGLLTPGEECKTGSGTTGVLCTVCEDGWSRQGLQGTDCKECSGTLSIAFVLLGGSFALFATVSALYIVAGIDASKSKFTTVVVLGKISITLCQIITQLGVALELDWPDSFDWFVNLLKLFSFDILAFINIGCIGRYSYFEKFTFAFAIVPVLVLSVFIVYQIRKSVDGMADRCIKMALAGVFLSYTFVSQTMFQGFACRQLDLDESWLAVDYQVSCESNEYIAFEVLGFIGVLAVPVGIPTLSLLLLLKNSAGIRDGPGDPSFDRFEFLVADYKPAFFYWDTVEMLRKVIITGLIMFVSAGSMLQLVVALTFSIAFATLSAWFQPYASGAANIFKVGTEVTILLTLSLAVLLRFDLSNEDITDQFVGVLLLFSSTVVPGATLALGVLTSGLEVVEEVAELVKDADFENPMNDDENE